MRFLKRIVQLAIIVSLTLTIAQLNAKAIIDFEDVPTTNQFYEPITWASSAGYINGYNDGTFKPKNYLTEAQFALMMTRFIEPNAFVQNKGKTERDVAYNVMKKYSIQLKGQTNKKAQNQTFTRLQVARAFYAYVEGKIPTDKQAIDWMYKYGISKGKGISTDRYVDFGSNDKLKREHMAQFFKNLYTNWYFEKHILKKTFTESDLFKENASFKDPLLTDFNGDGVKELLVTYETIPKQDGFEEALFSYRYFGLYSFNDETNKWTFESGDFLFTVGNDNWFDKELVSVTGDATQQLMMYFGAYRNLTVATITATDLKQIKVSTSELFAHEHPSWEFIGDKLVVMSSDSYSGLYTIEDGLLVRKSLTQLPKVEENLNAIKIHYSIDTRGYVKSDYYNGEIVYAKVGQTLDFVQGKYDWYEKSVRIMYSDSENVFGDYEEADDYFKYPGVFEVQILPLEDWDKALTLKVIVVE